MLAEEQPVQRYGPELYEYLLRRDGYCVLPPPPTVDELSTTREAVRAANALMEKEYGGHAGAEGEGAEEGESEGTAEAEDGAEGKEDL